VLKNEQIIYVSNAWFNENKTSSHHVAEVLAKHNRVLYIEASGQRAPKASGRDIKKIFAILGKVWKNPVQVEPNIHLYSPLILPLHKYAAIRKLNNILIKFMMRRACRKVGFDNPILWIFLPHYSSIIGSVNSKFIVYYCVDEYSSQPNVNTEMIKSMEDVLLKKADVVFAVSDNLLENKRKKNPNTFLSMHGVDVEHFMKCQDEKTVIPADIADIPKPIVGFIGLIEEWIDLDLIKYLATKREDVSFVFIGRVAQDISRLESFKNVYFLGQRPYRDLPNYLKAFDVGMMPYKMNTQVINSNPKKLREYLASGKPVLSVPVREVLKYKDLVHVADNYEEYYICMNSALEDNSEERIAARIDSIQDESWDAKVDRISNIIKNSLEGDGNGKK